MIKIVSYNQLKNFLKIYKNLNMPHVCIYWWLTILQFLKGYRRSISKLFNHFLDFRINNFWSQFLNNFFWMEKNWRIAAAIQFCVKWNASPGLKSRYVSLYRFSWISHSLSRAALKIRKRSDYFSQFSSDQRFRRPMREALYV